MGISLGYFWPGAVHLIHPFIKLLLFDESDCWGELLLRDPMTAALKNELADAIRRGDDDVTLKALVVSSGREDLLQMVQGDCETHGSLMEVICTLKRESEFLLLTRILEDEVLSALLISTSGHPYTAVGYAVRNGCLEILKFLATHPAFGLPSLTAPCDIPTGTVNRWLPVTLACLFNHTTVVKWLLATVPVGPELTHRLRTELPVSGFTGDFQIRDFVRWYISDPLAARRALRQSLKLSDEEVADVFALIIFLCEGLLQVPDDSDNSGRFFVIAQRLPMELQMRLCHLAAGPGFDRQSVLSIDSERAFKALALSLIEAANQ